jgi:polygalacturonase
VMEYVIAPGSVHVNHILCLLRHDDVIILHADTREKWPSIYGYCSDSDDDLGVMVDDESGDPTTISVTGLQERTGASWRMEASAGKYSIRISVWLDSRDDGEVVWEAAG